MSASIRISKMRTAFCVIFVAFFVHASNAELCIKDYISDNMLNDKYQESNKSMCEQCMLENGVTFGQLTQLEAQKPKHPDMNVQCYFKCYSILIGTMNSQGVFNDQFVAQVLESDVNEYAQDCLDYWKNLKEPCEQAYTVYRCILEARDHRNNV